MTLRWHCNEQGNESSRGFPPKGYEISYPLPTSGLAGSVLFFPWGVSSLWAERVPHRTSAWISLSLCRILAPIFWPWPLPCSSSRDHRPGWKHHVLSTVPSIPWVDFHCVSLLFFPILTPNSFSLLYTWSERALITQLQSFSRVSVRLSSHCVWLSQSSTSWTVLQVLKFKIEVSS